MTLGWQHITLLLTFVGGTLGAVVRQEQRFQKLMVEHEMLVDLLCEMTGKKRSDLPTRHHNGSF